MTCLRPVHTAGSCSRSAFSAQFRIAAGYWPLLGAALVGMACSSEPQPSGDTRGTNSSTATAEGGAADTETAPNAGGSTQRDTKASSGGADGTDDEASGGASSDSGGASSSDSGAGTFSLLFRDDFDSFDSSRWKRMTHSWSGNLAKFSPKSVSVDNGELSITLLEAPEGTEDSGETKPYFGAEVRSVATLTYGRVRARAKLANGSAVVSALVTIYTPWPADNWNELDIECLGKNPSAVQFNTQVYTGKLPAASTPVSPKQDPHSYDFGFDSSQDFHIYQIEWTPAAVVFTVDDQEAYRWDKRIDLMTLPQNVLLTIWASSTASWAGAVDDTTLGATAVYDWIELYEYAP